MLSRYLTPKNLTRLTALAQTKGTTIEKTLENIFAKFSIQPNSLDVTIQGCLEVNATAKARKGEVEKAIEQVQTRLVDVQGYEEKLKEETLESIGLSEKLKIELCSIG